VLELYNNNQIIQLTIISKNIFALLRTIRFSSITAPIDANVQFK
jgi:hypothetical protein